VPYPSTHSSLEDKGLTAVGKYTDMMSQAVNRRKPIMMFLQGGYNPDANRCPYQTYEETRFITFDSMLNHGNFIYYYGQQDNKKGGVHVEIPEVYDLVFKVSRELHSLSGLFSSGKILDDAKADATEIRCRVLECSGGKYLIAMNTSGKAVSSIISGKFKESELTVFPDGRKVKLTDGGFKQDFKPYEVFVYGEAAVPPPVYDLPAADPEMDKLGNPFHLIIEKEKKKKVFETKGSWIWEKNGVVKDGSKAFLGKSFKVSKPVKDARLNFAIDNQGATYLNGVELESLGWSEAATFDCTKIIKEGDNFLYVAAQDAGKVPCGAIVDLVINYADGTTENIISDDSWKASSEAGDPKKPESINGWAPAVIVAPYGAGAWKKIKVQGG
jgi:hypothetical protein